MSVILWSWDISALLTDMALSVVVITAWASEQNHHCLSLHPQLKLYQAKRNAHRNQIQKHFCLPWAEKGLLYKTWGLDVIQIIIFVYTLSQLLWLWVCKQTGLDSHERLVLSHIQLHHGAVHDALCLSCLIFIAWSICRLIILITLVFFIFETWNKPKQKH